MSNPFDFSDVTADDTENGVRKNCVRILRAARDVSEATDYVALEKPLREFCKANGLDVSAHENALYLIIEEGFSEALKVAVARLQDDTWRVELPPGGPRNDDLRTVATLCLYLDESSPSGEFYLGCRTVAGVLGKSHTHGNDCLRTLRRRGVIELLRESYFDPERNRQMAHEYRYISSVQNANFTHTQTQSQTQTHNHNHNHTQPHPQPNSKPVTTNHIGEGIGGIVSRLKKAKSVDRDPDECSNRAAHGFANCDNCKRSGVPDTRANENDALLCRECIPKLEEALSPKPKSRKRHGALEAELLDLEASLGAGRTEKQSANRNYAEIITRHLGKPGVESEIRGITELICEVGLDAVRFEALAAKERPFEIKWPSKLLASKLKGNSSAA